MTVYELFKQYQQTGEGKELLENLLTENEKEVIATLEDKNRNISETEKIFFEINAAPHLLSRELNIDAKTEVEKSLYKIHVAPHINREINN